VNIGEMQRKLSLWAEQDQNRRFYGLFDLVCDKDWLRLAHDHVAGNTGSVTAGCDGVDMDRFDLDSEGNLDQVQQALQAGTFVACPVRRVNIPKPNGKVRPLGIATIRDRIVQEAVRMVLEPIFEADFRQTSFGFRPNRRTMDAIKYLTWSAGNPRKRFFWVIEGDLSAYFDTIHHRRLVKLLKRRVKDTKLLDLIWKFLRAGVMERKLFKDTKLGVPQGGIASPLLANVYLHELDVYMERYTALSTEDKRRRRAAGVGNYAYVRYADDFVVLCSGTREDAERLRAELHQFLQGELRLTLSLEKTKITHIEDGFDFLGFNLRRRMGATGMGVKTLISEKAMQRHLAFIRRATSPSTHEESFVAKILALNRVIAGWCRYFQYTSQAGRQFNQAGQVTFWSLAHWLARKHQLSMPEAMRRYRVINSSGLGIGSLVLLRHNSFKAQRYLGRFFKPNPYTHQEVIEREELPPSASWTGYEQRPGMRDLRQQVLARDGMRCRMCGESVTFATARVDHIRPYRRYKRPVEANRLDNLWTLCLACHADKTEMDRQAESRVQ
jgi:RNA-directed DNA polymerase